MKIAVAASAVSLHCDTQCSLGVWWLWWAHEGGRVVIIVDGACEGPTTSTPLAIIIMIVHGV